MTVKDGFKALKKLMDEGHGDVILMGRDCRSGDSAEGGISNTISFVTGNEDCGELCDMEVGEEYVSLYMG